jgi:hypothetical protein
MLPMPGELGFLASHSANQPVQPITTLPRLPICWSIRIL